MRVKVYFRRKIVEREAARNLDSMTVMDPIHVAKKPAPKQRREQQQQQTRPADVVEGEAKFHEVLLAATDFSSGSDEDLGSVLCQHKRRKKCMDLSDILKREQSVVDRPQDESSQPRKAKNLGPIRKGHVVSPNRNGRRKVTAESRPSESILPTSNAVQRHLLHCARSQVGHPTDGLTEVDTRKCFSASLGLSQPVEATDGAEFRAGKWQRFRATAAAQRHPASQISKAGRKARSSSQLQKLQTSASEADLHPVSGYSLHTCEDAKNCQNACVAKAVAPHLDHMSVEELIDWYEEVTKSKFTQRNGEKVRGRIRRVIRAEVKRAAALTTSCDGRNNSNKSVCDEVQESISAMEPSTPPPGELVVDLHHQDSPRASEFPASVGPKETISCAFNSAASFDDDVGEERARTSPNCGEALMGAVPPLKDELELVDCRLYAECLAECEPSEIALVAKEPSVLGSAGEKRVPIDVAMGEYQRSESPKLESAWRDGESPSNEERKSTGEQSGDFDKFLHSDSREGQSLLPAEELEGPPSIGTEPAHLLSLVLKVKEGFEPVLNAFWIAESDSTKPPADSTRRSMDCLIASEVALFSPNLRPSSQPREQGSADSQNCTSLQHCDTRVPTGHTHSVTSAQSSPPDALALEVAGDLKPNYRTPIQGNSNSAAPATTDDENREESMEVSSQGEILSDGLFILQETAAALRDVQDQITKPAEGISSESETRQQVVDISFLSEPCDTGVSTGHTHLVTSARSNPPDALALEVAGDLKPNYRTPIQGNSNSAAPATTDDENREESMEVSSQGEVLSDGLFILQETAPALRDLQDQIPKPAEGISSESETRQQVVDISFLSEPQQSVDSVHQLLLLDTSGRPGDLEMHVPNEFQLSCLVEEQNTLGVLAEICETSRGNGSEQPGSSPARFDTSWSGENESGKGIDGPAETCRTANEVEGIDEEGLPSCYGPLHSDIHVEKLRGWDAENIPTLQIAPDGNEYGENESGKGIDGPAETCRTANEVEGIDEECLPSCYGPLMHSDIPVEEMRGWDAENIPTLQIATDDSEKEDRVLSLEEYTAVYRGEDAVFPKELEEDVATHGLEEDVASDLVESQTVSGEGKEDATKDELVAKFATQQMLGSVACCLKPRTSNDHVELVERIPSPSGRHPDEVVAVLKMKDLDNSQQTPEGTRNNSSGEFSTQELATHLTSHRFQGEEYGVQNQAEAEAVPTEIDISTSQDLEGDGTVEVKEKEVLPYPEDGNKVGLGGGAVTSEYVEEDFTARKVVNCANQLDGDLCDEDITVLDPEEDVGCKAMDDEKAMSQIDDSGGAAIEVDEALATQEIVKIVTVSSEQLPREILNCSNIEEDNILQDSEKNRYAPCLDELAGSQRRLDGITEGLTEESSSLHLGNYIMPGGNDLPGSGDCGAENQADLNHACTEVAGVDVPHPDENIATRRKEEVALQSLEGNAAPGQIADLSESSYPGPGSIQTLEVVDSLDQMDSSFDLGEDAASEHVEDVELHPAHGVVGICDDHTGSPDYVNDVSEANNFCEKAGEDSFEYPVVLSQPRRREAEYDGIQETVCDPQRTTRREAEYDGIQETVSDVQRTIQITTPVSRRITRASLRLDKNIRAVVQNLADCFKLSALPSDFYNCASAWDPQSVERNKPSVQATAEQSRPPKARSSLVSEEIEQVDKFEYAMLQEEEWQNAGKFSNQIDMSFFEENVAMSSPRKRKLNDPENISDRGKRVAVEAPLHEVDFGSVQDNAPQRDSASLKVTEENSMEDDHVPTALSKAKIERNGGRSGALHTFASLADQESPLTEHFPNAKQTSERRISREKRKVLLEHSPESKCDLATTAESNGCIDLLACEKLDEEASSQDFEPPSKLLCRRKTISPLSQLELMRASNSNSPPSDDSQVQKIPAFRLKLPPGLDGHHGGPSSFEREPTPDCVYLDASNKTGKDEASNGCVVSLDSSEDDTDDSCSRQDLGSRCSGGEPPRTFSLCLSPTSPSPESVRTDSSPIVSSQEPRDSQPNGAPSSKGILKPPQACKGPCKCSTCSTSRFTAGNAAGFVASQMKTFQLIAGSLTKEMQGLRSIIETNLSNPGEAGKIPETLKKCKDVEEAAQKNLATLRRDCKRYCKLAVTKPIRRISFADEAGKKLCHVKTFQSQRVPKSVLDLL